MSCSVISSGRLRKCSTLDGSSETVLFGRAAVDSVAIVAALPFASSFPHRGKLLDSANPTSEMACRPRKQKGMGEGGSGEGGRGRGKERRRGGEGAGAGESRGRDTACLAQKQLQVTITLAFVFLCRRMWKMQSNQAFYYRPQLQDVQLFLYC